MSRDFDLLVIGSGPAGQKAAIQAAKAGRKVAIVERRSTVGGVCVNTGTIPSKTFREAVLYLTGITQRSMYGQSYRLKSQVTIDDLFWRTQHVIEQEIDVVRDQLVRNGVTLLEGTAEFVDPHTVAIPDDGKTHLVSARHIVIATGTKPARPHTVEFDDRRIIDSDGILRLDAIPRSLVVVGGGVIGIEYAAMFAALRTRVTVIERGKRLLPFVDAQIVEALQYHLRELNVTFHLGEEVVSVETLDESTVTELASGKTILADHVLYSAGRQGAVSSLRLENAGLEADERGRIAVDDRYRTRVPHIYAVGDVIGFPSLASTSAEQGRLAACDACGIEGRSIGELLPIGIYTIPEISFVGRTEEELTTHAVPYEIGIAHYRELARGQILGDHYGLLKLLVEQGTGRILGVHVFGTSATELVHIGQAFMAAGATVDHVVDTVFNYPTLAEAYKVAALDVLNKMRAARRVADRRAAQAEEAAALAEPA